MGAHTTSDDPTRYRIASEVEAWQAKDPIARMRAFLDKQQIADDAFFAEVDEQAKQRVAAPARAGAGDARPAAADAVRQRLRQRFARSSTRSASSSAGTWTSFEGSAH